jgi:hypothetical protein
MSLVFLNTDSSSISEPHTEEYGAGGLGSAITFSLLLKNTSSDTITNIGLYLVESQYANIATDYLSDKSNSEMLSYLLLQGADENAGLLFDDEAASGIQCFRAGVGDALENKIPLLYNGGTLLAGESVRLDFTYIIDSDLVAEELGIAIVAA